MYRLVIFSSVLLLFAAGCDDNAMLPEERQLVLQAYLYAGEPVNAITVTLSGPISGTDSLNEPVTHATVALTKNGQRFLLSPLTAYPGQYHYAGAGLDVLPGDLFRIDVAYQGYALSASTTVPASPAGVTVNAPSIRFTKEVYTRPNGSTMERIISADSMIVRWTNPLGVPHFVVLESIDPGATNIYADSVVVRIPNRYIAEPTTEAFYRVVPQSLRSTGRYKATVYRVNQEYVDLYLSLQQDSRDLNEPRTNVTNGMGIFTAFACDSTFFTVILQ